VVKVKGKKELVLPWERFRKALSGIEPGGSHLAQIGGLRGKVLIGKNELLSGEKMDLIVRAATTFDFVVVAPDDWPRASATSPSPTTRKC
jgi:hypothetical protein